MDPGTTPQTPGIRPALSLMFARREGRSLGRQERILALDSRQERLGPVAVVVVVRAGDKVSGHINGYADAVSIEGENRRSLGKLRVHWHSKRHHAGKPCDETLHLGSGLDHTRENDHRLSFQLSHGSWQF